MVASLAGIFKHFRSFKAMVIGDFFLDTYTTGRVKRVSPEAPVPILEVLKTESRPGGAGNVACNLASLGATVCVIGRVGIDESAVLLKECLGVQNISTEDLFVQEPYSTPIKNRLIAENQQLLRVDHEKIEPLCPQVQAQVFLALEKEIPHMDVVAISDYGKGFLLPQILQRAIAVARIAGVPIIVDPKGTEFSKYQNAHLLKPNLAEAYAAAKLSPQASLDAVARELLRVTAVDHLLITRSEAGMSLFNQKGERTDFSVRVKEVVDVTGAGDTALAMICLTLALKLDLQVGVPLANMASGIAIERVGCVHVTLADLADRLLEFDSHSKIFDPSHSFALQQALAGKRYSLLVVQARDNILDIVRTLKGMARPELMLVALQDPCPSPEMMHLLSSLEEVDYLLLHPLSAWLAPEKTYTVAEGLASRMCL